MKGTITSPSPASFLIDQIDRSLLTQSIAAGLLLQSPSTMDPNRALSMAESAVSQALQREETLTPATLRDGLEETSVVKHALIISSESNFAANLSPHLNKGQIEALDKETSALINGFGTAIANEMANLPTDLQIQLISQGLSRSGAMDGFFSTLSSVGSLISTLAAQDFPLQRVESWSRA